MTSRKQREQREKLSHIKSTSIKETKELCCVFSVSLLITSLVSLKPKKKKPCKEKRSGFSGSGSGSFPKLLWVPLQWHPVNSELLFLQGQNTRRTDETEETTTVFTPRDSINEQCCCYLPSQPVTRCTPLPPRPTISTKETLSQTFKHLRGTQQSNWQIVVTTQMHSLVEGEMFSST